MDTENPTNSRQFLDIFDNSFSMIAVSNSFDLLSFAKYLPVHLLIYFEILGVKEGFPVFQGTFD